MCKKEVFGHCTHITLYVGPTIILYVNMMSLQCPHFLLNVNQRLSILLLNTYIINCYYYDYYYYYFFFEILYNIIIYNIILNFLFVFGVSVLILILRTLW